jgi:hypothetical protein
MMAIWARWFGVAAVAATTLLGVSDAHAGARLVLLQFSGRKADVLRDKVADSLERAGHSVVRSKSGSADVSSEQIQKLGRRADAVAVVGGRVRRHSMRSWSVSLTVNDSEGGARLGEEIEFKSNWLPGLAKELSDKVAKQVEAALEEVDEPLKAATQAEVWDADSNALDAAAVKSSADEASAGSSAETEAATQDGLFEVDPGVLSDRDAQPSSGLQDEGMVVRLRARGGLVHRTLDFSDDLYSRLRRQQANIWVYQVEGELYPFERPIGERLGIIASYESVFSGSVRDTDFSANYPVIFQEFFAGIRARHPVGEHVIGFDLTVGRMRAGLEDTTGAANIPDMDYTVLRSSLDFSLDLGLMRATGSAGFRLPLGYGEVSNDQWFPRIGGYGVEASVGASYPLTKGVSLDAAGTLRRYLLEMNSEPEDAMLGIAEVAGGAVDLYLGGYFGMTFRL